mmetsp:Transcript_39914/g.80654  ORF Transcript_39914/g.80654 Transcript_39914/m.80654 type:complete len:249 (-) Transcript_39914:85-831(-)
MAAVQVALDAEARPPVVVVKVLEDWPLAIATLLLLLQGLAHRRLLGPLLPRQAVGDEDACEAVRREAVRVELVVLRDVRNLAALRAGLRDDGVLLLQELLEGPVRNSLPGAHSALEPVRALRADAAVGALLEVLPEVEALADAQDDAEGARARVGAGALAGVRDRGAPLHVVQTLRRGRAVEDRGAVAGLALPGALVEHRVGDARLRVVEVVAELPVRALCDLLAAGGIFAPSLVLCERRGNGQAEDR